MTINVAYGTASTSAATSWRSDGPSYDLGSVVECVYPSTQTLVASNPASGAIGTVASWWGYSAYQLHQRIAASRVATERVVSAWLTLSNTGVTTPQTTWDVVAHHVAGWYGADAYVGNSELDPSLLVADIPGASMAVSSSTPAMGGTKWLVGLLNAGTSNNIDLVVNGGNTLATSFAYGNNYTSLYMAAQSGTTYDPRLTYSTLPVSNGIGQGAACVQLADGSTVHASWSGSLTGLTLYRRSGGTNTVLAAPTVPVMSQAGAVANSAGAGQQVVSLARDDADNIYVIVGVGGALYAQAFAKTAASTWSARGMLSQTIPLYDTANAWAHNTVTAWHSAGGTAGTIVAVGHYCVGAGDTATQWWATLNCDALLSGSGTLLRGSGDGTTLFAYPSVTAFTTYQNATGTGLDIAAASSTTGFAATYNRKGQVSFCSYTLAANGASFSSVAQGTIADTIYQDANSKLRVLAYSPSVVILVYGSVVKVRQLSAGSWVSLGAVDLSAQGMTTFPTAAAMLSTAAWDATYDPTGRKVFVYYLSAADGNRLMRTSVDSTTWLAARDEVQVSAAIGAGGSSNPQMRVHRGATTGFTTVVTCANVATGTYSNVYVQDTTQVAPSAPILTPRQNYDATQAAAFVWTPQDTNPGDSQTAYQLQIVTATGDATYDSDKATSETSTHTLTADTLTNPGSWQWRVKTWDAADLEGAWSDYSSFQTAAGGNVTITDPASDNPAGLDTASVTVTWETAGATQAAYRVQVTVSGTGASLVDTGWVTSTDTSYTVNGMTTDVTYQVSVKTRTATSVESGAGLRLVTPSFGTPMAPVITAEGVPDGGHVLVTVTNPAPEGDRPEVVTNVVQRRPSGVGEYVTVGSCGHGDSFPDYTASAGVAYDYRVSGSAATSSTLSNVATASVSFLGVWIHDPLDPAGTVHAFPYGKSQRSASIDVEAAGTHYAGRAYPVYDYGESQDDQLQLKLNILNGTNLATDLAAIRGFATARRTLHVKDNRGRAMYAALSDYQESDQDWGSQVSVNAVTVHYEAGAA